jgi:hypothetical protein
MKDVLITALNNAEFENVKGPILEESQRKPYNYHLYGVLRTKGNKRTKIDYGISFNLDPVKLQLAFQKINKLNETEAKKKVEREYLLTRLDRVKQHIALMVKEVSGNETDYNEICRTLSPITDKEGDAAVGFDLL